MDVKKLPRATELAHAVVRGRVQAGDTVVDGTVGAGADTVFLASLVGTAGRVIGFDVQQEALDRAGERLAEDEPAAVIELHHCGHERLAEWVEGEIAAAMFNLGYLPGGDKSVITQTTTTVAALEAAVSCLRVGGVVTVVCYPGHAGGAEEAEAVYQWAAGLAHDSFSAVHCGLMNQRQRPPFLIAVERSAD